MSAPPVPLYRVSASLVYTTEAAPEPALLARPLARELARAVWPPERARSAPGRYLIDTPGPSLRLDAMRSPGGARIVLRIALTGYRDREPFDRPSALRLLDRLVARAMAVSHPCEVLWGDAAPECRARRLQTRPVPEAAMFDRLERRMADMKEGRSANRSARSEQHLPRRLAVYVLNAAIMSISLPVGMAMLAYNLVRGTDAIATARLLSVAGTATGLVTYANALPLP